MFVLTFVVLVISNILNNPVCLWMHIAIHVVKILFKEIHEGVGMTNQFLHSHCNTMRS